MLTPPLYPRCAPALLLLALVPRIAFAAAPTVTSFSGSVNEDASVNLTLRGSDADHDALTYSIVTNPAHGTVTLSGSTATYRPTANYNGADSFVYKVRDATGATSGNATVSLTVNAVNDAPTATAATITGTEDNRITANLAGSDVDGNALTWSITSAPTQGSVSVVASTGVATYTPPANWSGSTSFRYQVSDGTLSAGAVITVTVSAVNDAPVATASTFTLGEDTTANVALSATDIDSSTLTYALVTSPAHGVATLSGRNLTYTPTANWNGTDTLTFVASDGSATSAPATVTLSVSPTNDPPTVTDVNGSIDEDTPFTVTLTGNDVDGDALTYTVDSATNGLVTVSGRVATFMPTANFHGSARFSFRASDGTALSGTGTATIDVRSVNDAPVANAQTVTLAEDAASTAITLVGTDADNDTLTYAVVTAPAHGTLGLSGRTAVYTPTANWSGTDTFTFVASDGTAASSPATVTLSVAAVNDAPIAYASAAMTDGRAVTLTVEATDVDSTLGAPVIVSPPAHGTASIVSGAVRYTPANGWIGIDHLTVSVSDGSLTTTAPLKVSTVGSWGTANAEWSQVGVNSEPFYADATSTADTASPQFQAAWILDDLNALGIDTYRQPRAADLTWESVEPTQDSWQLDDTDDMLALGLQEPRFTLFDTMFASPTAPWATGPAEFQKSMTAESYAYLDAVVTRYADSTRYWEVGNEMFHWFALDNPATDPSTIADLPDAYPTDGYSPEEQAEFLRDAALEVRALDPDALIVLPSVIAGSAETNEWLERVVAHTGSDWFDVVAYHAYAEWQVTRGDRPALEAELASLGLSDKLLQLTETGSSCYSDQTAKTDYPNDESSQASDVFRLLIPAFAAGDSQVDWHAYRELAEHDLSTQGGLGLYAYDTSPRPAAYTMQLLTTELLPMVQVTDLSSGGVLHYVIRSLDGSVHHVLWGNGSTTVPAGMTQAVSVVVPTTGAVPWTSVTAGSTVTLSSVPVLYR